MNPEVDMSGQATSKQGRFLNIDFAPMGIGFSYQLSLNLDDPGDVERKIVDLVEIGQAPLRAKIQGLTKENGLLKQRVLTPDEIQHLAHLVKAYPRETRYDGRATVDDALAAKLEGMLKS
jgi:hypothetical protein